MNLSNFLAKKSSNAPESEHKIQMQVYHTGVSKFSF